MIADILKNFDLLTFCAGKYAKQKHVHAYDNIVHTRVKIVKLPIKHFC